MGNKRRIWIISELYYPETTSTGYILTKIAEGLSGDFEVHALCAQPSYAKRGMKAAPRELRNGVLIHRCSSTTFDKDRFLLRLLNLATVSISMFFNSVILLRPYDVALVVTNPPAMPFFIRVACGLKGARPLLLVHDVYPELLVAVGKLNHHGFVTKVLSLASLALFRSMERIIVLGRDMQRLINDKMGSREDRVVIARNWADLDSIRPQLKKENALLKSIQAVDQFVALYAGNMSYPHDIETIVKAAERLREHGDVRFLFIGSGFKRSWLLQAIHDKALSNVSLMSPLPREEQMAFLNACDVGLISLVKGMKGISVPSRYYNILASGKPIIAIVESDSETGIDVESNKLGWVIPPGRPDQLAKAILEAREDQRALMEMGRRARELAEARYSFEHTLAIFRRLLKETK